MAKTVLDNCDNVANWVSSDNTHFAKSQDEADKREGTGSIKVVTSASYAYSGDRCSGGTPSANSEHAGYPAAEAFDNNTGTRWMSDTETGWIQYYFPIYHVIRRVRLKPYSISRWEFIPKDFNIQVYTDTWHTVYTGQHAKTDAWETYSFSNSYSSRYCRINILSIWNPGDTHIEIAEIEMMTYDVIGSALNDTIIRDLGA